MTKLLGISGSLRKDSYNSMLLAACAQSFGGDYALADLNLPLYDGDVEKNDGIPADVQTLFDQIAAADALIIATPEYNGSLSGVLKNALDWVSRIDGKPMADTPTAIMSATAGRAGGVMALSSLRLCLAPFHATIVNGPLVAVASCYEVFDADGTIKDERYQNAVVGLMEKLKASI